MRPWASAGDTASGKNRLSWRISAATSSGSSPRDSAIGRTIVPVAERIEVAPAAPSTEVRARRSAGPGASTAA